MVEKRKEFFGNKLNWLGILLALTCVFIHFPRYFDGYFTPLSPSSEAWWGLDTSWVLTLNYVNIKHLIWGTDFAFTYGPLSYLSTKLGWGTSGNGFILFDIFFYLNLFLVYLISFVKSKNKVVTSLLIIGYTLLVPVFIGPPIALLLLIFLVFWIRMSLDKPKLIYYLFQSILLFLLVFIKFNTGLIAFPLFFVGLLYNLISKKEKFYWLLLYALTPIIIIVISCSYLNVGLVSYVKSALEIISGYNDVMYLEHKFILRLLALFVVFSTVFILAHKLVVERKTKENLLKNTAIFLLYSIPIFVLYKSGFVRGMETDFFIYSIPLILVIKDLHFENYKKYSSSIIVICILISFEVVYFDKDVKMPFETTNKIDKHYLSGAKDFTPISGLHIFPNNNQIPNSVKEKIGTNTVDIYPWNAQLLLENKLNFLPRPVFQAYTAYTPYLEEMNFNHYNSYAKAPEFVVYEYLAMDERYPLFDEPKVNLCLLKNYSPVELFDFQDRKFILLQKHIDFKPIKLEKTKEYAMYIDSPIVPKQDVYYQIGVYNSTIGSIMSIINHAPKINIEIHSINTPIQYRTGKKLLETGLFLDKNITSTEDFYSLFFKESSVKLAPIKFLSLKPSNTLFFTDKIRITEYKITQ